MKVAFYGKTSYSQWAQVQESDISVVHIGPDHVLPSDTDLLVTLGGDGTFLEALEIVRDSGVPIAGVNFGRLGFLSGTCPVSAQELLQLIREGKYTLRQHTILEAISPSLPPDFFSFALNECNIQRNGPAMLEVDVKVDGQDLATFRGDGLIVATPTGSTAYSLSVGGPVVFPGSGVWVISPIAPHNLNMRPVVLPDSSDLQIEVRSRGYAVQLNMDNRSMKLPEHFAFTLRKAPFFVTSLLFPGFDFITTLRDKLMWGFDKRNSQQ